MPFLTDFPEDLRSCSAARGSVIGIATGWAIGRGEPALALLHTTAGLGNAVGALATARVNRAPLVVLVGQQDRRHLAFEPFLAGRLRALGGEYVVWVDEPVRGQDVPGAIGRAAHEAETQRGPALVVVPMDDWGEPADEDVEAAAPARVVRATAADPAAVEELARFLEEARAPTWSSGRGRHDADSWEALVGLASGSSPRSSRSRSAHGPVPAEPPPLRRRAARGPSAAARAARTLRPVLVVGAPAFRQSPYAPGRFAERGRGWRSS